ncbi:MAG: class I SAM-dependent methyltransferase [Deltaproteobacteria bacterium]|nr:class I SAM-dependent methyltransferase [Deltaproteobacteria bacterium]
MKAYESGYGIRFPESHVIRVYERILKYEFNLSGSAGEAMLDFGCGNGTHCEYFNEKGFDVHGVDADKGAIEICKERFPSIHNKFSVVPPNPESYSTSFFGIEFRFILSNQTLYYLSDGALELCLESLANQLGANGIIVATMMGTKNWFFDHSLDVGNGISRVELINRQNNVSFINFTSSEEDLINKFRIFEPLHIGYYDCIIRSDEGSNFHYLFVGKKR